MARKKQRRPRRPPDEAAPAPPASEELVAASRRRRRGEGFYMTNPAPTPEVVERMIANEDAWVAQLPDVLAAARELFAGEDAFDILACTYVLHFMNLARPPAEREVFVDSLAVGEYAAMVLVERPARAPEQPDHAPEPWDALNSALPLLQRLTLGTSWALSRYWHDPEDPVVALNERFLGRYILVPIAESDRQARLWFHELFGEPRIDAWMREELGFGVEDGERLVDALLELTVLRTFTATRALQLSVPLLGVGEAVAFTPEQLADHAGVGAEAARRLCELIATEFGQPPRSWPALPTPIRRRPLVTDGNGRYLAAAPAMVRRGLRHTVAAALNPKLPSMGPGSRPVYDVYLQRRGALLEHRGMASLGALLRPGEAHANLHFQVRGADGEWRSGEIDGLLVLDRTVVVIQAKSAPTRIDAVAGDGAAFAEALDAIVKEAMRQHDDARSALLAPRGDVQFWTQEGKADTRVDVVPDLPADMEIHPITVTLDDLAGCAPVAWRLRDAGLATDGELPWIVGTMPLDVMVELCSLPAQMIHFLRRRAWLNVTRNVEMQDELDVFLEYLHDRLEVVFGPRERDGVPVVWFPPERFHALASWTMRADDDTRRRDKGLRLKLHRAVRAVLERLDRERGARWLEASLALLDAPLMVEQRIGSALTKVGDGREPQSFMGYNMMEGRRETLGLIGEPAGRRLDDERARAAVFERARERGSDTVTALVLPELGPIRVLCAADRVA
jgi:hypothetical protein